MTVDHQGNEPLRVALITRSLAMGGAERHIVKLCQAVAQHNVTLSLFLLVRDEPKSLLPALQPYDLSVFVSPFQRHHPRVITWLARQLRDQQAHVAHSFLWIPDAVASLAKAVAPHIALVCSERGDRGHVAYYSLVKRLFDRLITFHTAERFCANSQFGSRLLAASGCSPTKIRTIYNGVDLTQIDAYAPADLRALLGWPNDCQIVGTVSRLVEYKGVDMFIHALAQLKCQTSLYGVVVGDGPCRPQLEQLAQRLGVADRVAFLGIRSPAESFIKGFDISVLATRTDTEHCSNSILEYMACSKPVIATRVGGNAELVTNDETGILVQRDDPAQLAQALKRLSSCPQQARQMGVQGRKRIEAEFQLEHIAAQFVALWYETANAQQRAHCRAELKPN